MDNLIGKVTHGRLQSFADKQDLVGAFDYIERQAATHPASTRNAVRILLYDILENYLGLDLSA